MLLQQYDKFDKLFDNNVPSRLYTTGSGGKQ